MSPCIVRFQYSSPVSSSIQYKIPIPPAEPALDPIKTLPDVVETVGDDPPSKSCVLKLQSTSEDVITPSRFGSVKGSA